MPIPTAKLAQKRAKLRVKTDGSSVVLKWIEWPNGQPDEDPTSGAKIVQDDPTKAPVNKTATVRAFVHFAQPITSGYRKFAEIQSGDAIVDFPLDLLRITDPGDTSLVLDQVVDEIAFSAANRAISDIQESAAGDAVEPTDLASLCMEFAGHKWVQKEVGEELARNWDTLYAGLNINRAMLMTKA